MGGRDHQLEGLGGIVLHFNGDGVLLARYQREVAAGGVPGGGAAGNGQSAISHGNGCLTGAAGIPTIGTLGKVGGIAAEDFFFGQGKGRQSQHQRKQKGNKLLHEQTFFLMEYLH